MLKVLTLDVRSTWPYQLAVLLLGGIGALSTARLGPAYLWWNALLAVGCAAAAPVVEWRNDTTAFLHSLPVRRDDVVAGRLAGGVAAVLVSGALGSLLALGLAAALTAVGRPWPAWIGMGSLLAFLVVASWLVGLALASVFVFGVGAGATFASVVVLLSVVAVELPVGWFVDAPAVDSVRPCGGVVRLGLEWMALRFGWTAATILSGVVAGVVFWGAGRVALRVHRDREF